MAQGQRQRQERSFITGTYRNFQYTIPALAGINETLSPFSLRDEELVTCVNFLPTSFGNLKKITAPLKVFSTQHPIIKMVTHPLNGQYYCLIFLADGSLWMSTNQDNTSFIQKAGAGTFSTDPALIDFCVWQNQRIYIVDKQKGYFRFQNGQLTQVTSALKGNTILVWQGRVFIGNESIVQYSVALEPENFTGSGSGYFDLVQSFPALKLRVKKLLNYIDNLLILGDNAILILTGTTISNDPSQWYLTQVSDAIGVRSNNLVCFYNNEFWLQNEKGIYKGVPTSLDKFDYKIDTSKLTFLNRQTGICQINNLIFYPILVRKISPIDKQERDIILFWAEHLNEFYYVDLGFNVWGIYWSNIEGYENQIYVLGQDGLYKWEKNPENPISCIFISKGLSLDDLMIEKLWRSLYCNILLYPPYQLNLEVQLKTENEIKTNYNVKQTENITITNQFVFGLPDGKLVFWGYPQIEWQAMQWQNYTFMFAINNNLVGVENDLTKIKVPFFNLHEYQYELETGEPSYTIRDITIDGINPVSAIIVLFFDVIGRYCFVHFKETSSTIFEITNLNINGQIGRKVI